MNQRGMINLIALAAILLLVLAGGYYLGTLKNRSQATPSNLIVYPSPAVNFPNLPAGLSIPIYPGAKFDHTEDSAETTTYVYKTNDTFGKVLKWYEPTDSAGNPNPSTAGWVLKGGGGSIGDRYGNLQKGSIGYKMVVTDTEIKITTPKLDKSIESQILNELGSAEKYQIIAISGNLASGVTSSSGWIAMKDSNQWKILWQGKNPTDDPECSLLDKYKVPNAFSCRDDSNMSKGISQDDSVNIVLNLPEVKDYMGRVKNSKVEYDHVSTDGTKWVIHVYEQLPDHTATLNWFDVDKTTGQVTKEFFLPK